MYLKTQVMRSMLWLICRELPATPDSFCRKMSSIRATAHRVPSPKRFENNIILQIQPFKTKNKVLKLLL